MILYFVINLTVLIRALPCGLDVPGAGLVRTRVWPPFAAPLFQTINR